MAWTSPATVAAGQLMTASFWNTHVRDNELYLFGADIWSRLWSNSGTNTSTTAATVDNFGLGGLTAQDTLVIEVTLESITQQTAHPMIYNVTDALEICQLTTGAAAIPAGGVLTGTTKIRQRQLGATKVAAYHIGIDPTAAVLTTNTWNALTFTTNWTGSWSIGLRHTGVTSGGTLRWNWAVYKVVGQ